MAVLVAQAWLTYIEGVRTRVYVLILAATLLSGCTALPQTPVAQPTPAKTITVPDVAGKRLSQARAILEGVGLGNVGTTDATGKGRVVIEPNNWIVKAQNPKAGATVARTEKITLDVAKPTDGIGPATVTTGVMPDVVCMELQAAQDKLQEAGFYLLSSKDALGDRHQILDRDWVVIGQSVAAGKITLPLAKITLTVVKYGEPTGDSGCKS
jgi:beta-lactam-binding protein with PASTA domain